MDQVDGREGPQTTGRKNDRVLSPDFQKPVTASVGAMTRAIRALSMMQPVRGHPQSGQPGLQSILHTTFSQFSPFSEKYADEES
jgi:hypothetical protein